MYIENRVLLLSVNLFTKPLWDLNHYNATILMKVSLHLHEICSWIGYRCTQATKKSFGTRLSCEGKSMEYTQWPPQSTHEGVLYRYRVLFVSAKLGNIRFGIMCFSCLIWWLIAICIHIILAAFIVAAFWRRMTTISWLNVFGRSSSSHLISLFKVSHVMCRW